MAGAVFECTGSSFVESWRSWYINFMLYSVDFMLLHSILMVSTVSGTQRLPRLVGLSKALEMMLVCGFSKKFRQ